MRELVVAVLRDHDEPAVAQVVTRRHGPGANRPKEMVHVRAESGSVDRGHAATLHAAEPGVLRAAEFGSGRADEYDRISRALEVRGHTPPEVLHHPDAEDDRGRRARAQRRFVVE